MNRRVANLARAGMLVLVGAAFAAACGDERPGVTVQSLPEPTPSGSDVVRTSTPGPSASPQPPPAATAPSRFPTAMAAPLDELDPSIGGFLDSRAPQWGFAIYLLRSGTIYQVNGNQPFPLASLAKAITMLALLHQHALSGEELASYEYSLLESMIVYSDNDAAEILWQTVGRAEGVGAFLEAASISGIALAPPEFGWGDATSTPVGMARMLALLYDESFLTPDYRLLALDLLTSAALYQGWGAGAAFPAYEGVPAFGIKNGWYPAATGWRVASAALSRSPELEPMVFVGMTRTQESFEVAVQTIEGVAQRVGLALYGIAVDPFPPGEAWGPGPTEGALFLPSADGLPEQVGQCGPSQIAPRQGAYACELASGPFDPCFVGDAPGIVVCAALPSNPDDAFAVRVAGAGQAPQPRTTQASPWYLELVDGARCHRTLGGAFDYDGEQVTFTCDDGRVVVGDLQRSTTWWAFVEDFATGIGSEIPVLRAWF